MINRRKSSKTLNKVKPAKNINKNLQSFLEISAIGSPSFAQTARPCKYQNPFQLKEGLLTEKLPESFESFKFAPHRGRMSGEFNSSKDSHSTKFSKNLNEIQIYLVYILLIMWSFHSFKKRSKSVLSNDN